MMRASFVIVAASFVVVFAMAAAMDLETEFTISSTADTAAKCQKQIKKQQKLFACQRYLLKSSKMPPPSSSPSMSFHDNINQESINWRQEFPECCEHAARKDFRKM